MGKDEKIAEIDDRPITYSEARKLAKEMLDKALAYEAENKSRLSSPVREAI